MGIRIVLDLIIGIALAAYWQMTYNGRGDFALALWATLVAVIVIVGPRRFLRFMLGMLEMVGAIG